MVDVNWVFVWGFILACGGIGLVAVGFAGGAVDTDTASPAVSTPAVGGETVAVAADDDDRPLAEAGLDQWVDQHTTVYLDAGGSYAPEGDIAAYDWELERPNGTVTTPACSTCAQTRFVATQSGTYTVTVTVTDSVGRADSDTLYVHVSERIPPEATLDGPAELNVSEVGTFELAAEAGTYDLQAVQWAANGDIREGHFVDATDSWEEQEEFAFEEAGRKTVSAIVLDESGFSVTATHDVDVGNFSHFNVTIVDTTSPVGAGDEPVVTARIENEGNEADEQLLTLRNETGALLDSSEVALDPGNVTERTLAWEECLTPGAEDLTVSSDDDHETTTLWVSEETCIDGVLAIDSLDAPATVIEGETVSVTATVTETAGGDTTQQLGLSSIHDVVVDVETATLDGGESSDIDLVWETEVGDAGTGDLRVAGQDDAASKPLVVLEAPWFAVDIDDVSEPTEFSSDLTVEATITNTGEARETQTIRLTRGGGTELDRHRRLSLAGGESATVSLTWSDAADHPGDHSLTVRSDDDSDTATVDIEDTGGTTGPYYTGRFESPPTAIEQGTSMSVAVTVTDYTIHFDSSSRRSADDYDVDRVWRQAPARSKWAIADDHDDVVTSPVIGSIRVQEDAPAGDTVTVCVRGHQNDPHRPYTAGTSEWGAPAWDTFGLGPANECTELVIVEEDSVVPP